MNNKFKYLFPYDLLLPSKKKNLGSLHPITKIINNINSYFFNKGFNFIYGPEIETNFFNFKALNINNDHPSRNINDTFWLSNIFLLRTQTSSIQIKINKYSKLPIKIISIGKVYRKDNEDIYHLPIFHQTEGLIIDKKINMIKLLSLLKNFLIFYFKKKLKFNIRPSYFPFTSPSVEIDIYSNIKKKWIEILGCGLIHPNILKKLKINQNIYNGVAFGIGLERLIMLKYHISDIRLLYQNNYRFLKQFNI